jgi:hypothetical protein
MNGDPSQTHETDPQLPGPLRAELSRVYRVDASAMPPVDQKILSRARAHFAGRRRLRLVLEVAAVAAIILLVIGIAIPVFTRTDTRMHQARSEARGDINADGVIDIRDALLLARRIDQQQTRPINDYNRDGVVDHRDVDAIAMMAVSLGQKGATR